MKQEPSEEDKVALSSEGDRQKSQQEQPQQKKPIPVPTQNPPQAQPQKEKEKDLTRYYDKNERQIHIKDFPELIGKGPSGCLALLVFVMLLISIDPIFVGYGIIIGLIKLAEWIGNLFL